MYTKPASRENIYSGVSYTITQTKYTGSETIRTNPACSVTKARFQFELCAYTVRPPRRFYEFRTRVMREIAGKGLKFTENPCESHEKSMRSFSRFPQLTKIGKIRAGIFTISTHDGWKFSPKMIDLHCIVCHSDWKKRTLFCHSDWKKRAIMRDN